MANEQAGKVGAIYGITGDAITETLAPIGEANGTVFYLQETVIDCESLTPGASESILAGAWEVSGGTSTKSADATDAKEGTNCIKNDVTVVDSPNVCVLEFTMSAVQDWHDRAMILLWMRCNLAQDGFTSARFEVEDSDNHYTWWNLTFGAGEWTRQELTLAGGDGGDGDADAPNVDLTKVEKVRLSFVASGNSPFYQEIDFIGLTPHATSQSITVKVDGSEVAKGEYQHTVSGKVTFAVAPTSGEITATWSSYDIVQVAGFFSWGIDQVAAPLDKTDFESGGHKEYIVGLDEWSATAERHYHTDTDMHVWVGTIKIIKFFNDASADPRLRWEGWAVVAGLHPGVAVDTIINETLDFTGTGVLTYEST